jgi:uncharacterized repeat protein (TIGR03803 family)
VILDGSGNVYGTTSGGGGSRCDCGTVFKLSLGTNEKWTRTVLHRFNSKDGENPFAGVISDAAGNLYGTTWLGGNSQNPCYSNCGVVFKLHLERMARGRRPCRMSSVARTGLSLMLD